MSAHLRERQEKIQHVLERLIEESSTGIPIIVEGKKDVETLRQLGLEGKIVSAKTGGKSRLDVVCEVEESGAKEVIMLFDFDRRGREWTKAFSWHLERARIKPNLVFWNQLLRFAGKDIRDIESLTAYTRTLKKKVGGMFQE